MSALSNDSETESQPECPLHGAAFHTITHFGKNIATLKLEKEYFEEAEHGIVDFSQLIVAENDKNNTILTQTMVNHMFTSQVLDLYDFGHPMAEKVLGQLDYPLMKRFWEVRTSPETFHLRNSKDTHNEFRWSVSVPTKAQRAMDTGMVVLENQDSKVKVPLIGLISSPEDLDIQEMRQMIKRANKGIKIATVFAVLEGVLKHLYRDPLQDIRENKCKEIEAIIAAARKTHRPQSTQIPVASQEAGRQSSSSKSSNPHAPAIAAEDQPSDYTQSTTAHKRRRV